MVLGLVLVNLMDWDGGVDDGWLDGLLLDDGLDVLVDVVVDVLAGNGWVGGRCMFCGANLTGVLELSLLGCNTLLDMIIVAVLDVAVLNTDDVV